MFKNREFTGRDAAFVFVGGFVIIIMVNVILTVYAVGSFPGLDVKNAYVASQEFDEQKARQEALGWQSEISYAEGRVTFVLNDANNRPVTPNSISIKIGRATTARDDAILDLRFNGSAFVAEHELQAGKWLAFVEIIAADGESFRQVREIYVPS